MKNRKKYAAAAIIAAVALVNIAATLQLFFNVSFPERVLKEQVSEYFKSTLDKAVKFEDLHIDSCGNLVLSYFNVSITSDFNDNISLVRSAKTVMSLGLPALFTGSIRVSEIDFYDADITLIKKYGKSHKECLLALLDPDRLLAKLRKSREAMQVRLHASRIFYRESLRERQVSLEMYRVGAELEIGPDMASYAARGKIKPYRTEILRKGSFSCGGTIDLRKGGPWEHRVEVENFDLTYLNDYITEYKVAGIALNGGVSVDIRFGEAKGALSSAGRVEANSLSVASIEKKYDIISNENMDLDFDITVDRAQNKYTVRRFNLSDDVISLDASGTYVENDKNDSLALNFKTNEIDLSDLSQTLTPLKDVEYAGTLKCDGAFLLDFKKNTAAKMRADLVLDDFTIVKNDRGTAVTLVGETSMRFKASDSSAGFTIKGRPLDSDIELTGKTKVEQWVPLKSASIVSLRSKKMNMENIRLALLYLANGAYESAYDDKRGSKEKSPFLQRPIGKFMNNNTIDFTSEYGTVFYGKKAGLHNVVLNARLTNGAVSIGEFRAEGYDATFALSGQGYFNSDQPYIKIAGRADGFDLGRFYADSGMDGSLTGAARADFSYEVSISRIGDLLDNARGSLNLQIGPGEMKNTKFQRDLVDFLSKSGHDPSLISLINFQSITLSMTELGENFWFSNVGIRGDTLLFTISGDYLFEGGISSRFALTMKTDAGMVAIPLHLHGPLLAPCLDASDKKDSPRLCF